MLESASLEEPESLGPHIPPSKAVTDADDATPAHALSGYARR
jgi:hypothetical protein